MIMTYCLQITECEASDLAEYKKWSEVKLESEPTLAIPLSHRHRRTHKNAHHMDSYGYIDG